MNVYVCPVCRNRSVSWDTRSGAFVCRMVSCRRGFRPPLRATIPSVPEFALPNDQPATIQSWLDSQQEAGTTSR
jgi:hypothetical protein